MSSKLKELYHNFLNVEPMLPGTIKGQYSVCGNPSCRCADKENPIKHGPQNKLSFSLAGKSSTIFIRKADVALAQQMTGNFVILRELQAAIIEESVRIYRDKGATLANEEILNDIAHAKSEVSEEGIGIAQLDELEKRLKNWKMKARERSLLLRKNTAQLKSLTAGRDKWKKEAIELRKSIQIQNAENKTLRKMCSDQENKILSSEEEFKKR